MIFLHPPVVFDAAQTPKAVVVISTRASGLPPSAIGERITDGTTLKLAANQSRVLVHLKTGARVNLQGPCIYVVTAKGFVFKSGTKASALGAIKMPLVAKSAALKDRIGGVVTRGSDDEDLGPKEITPTGFLNASQDTIRWQGFIDGDQITLEVTDGTRSVWSTKLPRDAKSVSFPAECRAPGTVFTCTLAVLEEGRFKNSAKFEYRYLTPPEQEALATFEAQLTADPNSFETLVGLYEFGRATQWKEQQERALKHLEALPNLSETERAWIAEQRKAE